MDKPNFKFYNTKFTQKHCNMSHLTIFNKSYVIESAIATKPHSQCVIFQIDYKERYHRCGLGRDSPIAHISALFVPFLLVLLMYIIMLIIIIKKKRRFGQFLAISSGIIVSSLFSYAPTIIAIAWSVPMSYEVSQILTVTLYYVNGIINPMVYFVAHPRTQQYVGRKMGKDRKISKHPTSFNVNN